MANTNRETVSQDSGNGSTAPTFKQPVKFHKVAATGRGRGYYIRIPHLPVIDDIAAAYGPAMAEIWYRAALRQLTQLMAARGSAKDVAQTREAEQAAMEKAAAEFADGSLRLRGDEGDDEDSVDGGSFNEALLAAATPTLVASLEKIGKDASYVKMAFAQYYDALAERFGPTIAAVGYTPTKKGSGGAAKPKAEKLEGLDLSAALT